MTIHEASFPTVSTSVWYLRSNWLLSFTGFPNRFSLKFPRAEVVGRHNFPLPLLDSGFDGNERERQAYTTMLASLSNTLRIYTGFREDDPLQNVHGSTNALTNQRVPVYEQINSKFIDWYSQADYDARNVQKKNMIAYALATTLVREHAHAVWKMRNHAIFMKAWGEYEGLFSLEEFVRRATPTEPLVSLRDREPDLGMSWEHYFCGGLFPHPNGTVGSLAVKANTGTCWITWDML